MINNAAQNFWSRTLILIPALDEAESIPHTVAFWRGLGAENFRIIDNGSTDNTAKGARETGAEVVAEPRRGYGAAAWRGLQNLPEKIEWILFSSADGSDRLTSDELNGWLHEIDEGADFILGNRLSSEPSRQRLNRIQYWGNRFACWLMWLGWRREKFQDMGSLRVIRRDALEKLHLQDRGFGWNIEMQTRAMEHGLRIVELPVQFQARHAGRSKISGNFLGTIQASWGILSKLAHLWMTRH